MQAHLLREAGNADFDMQSPDLQNGLGLDERYWQAPATGEPVYHPSLGIGNMGHVYSFLIGLPATIPVLVSVHTAARVISLKCSPNHVCSLLTTLQ